MKNIYRLCLSASVVVALLTLSPSVRAEEAGAPANVRSDYKSHNLNLNIQDGRIDGKSGKVEAGAGVSLRSDGSTNAVISGEASTAIMINGTETRNESFAALNIEPKVKFNVEHKRGDDKYLPGTIRNAEIESGGLGVAHGEWRSFATSRADVEKAKAFDEKISALHDKFKKEPDSAKKLAIRAEIEQVAAEADKAGLARAVQDCGYNTSGNWVCTPYRFAAKNDMLTATREATLGRIDAIYRDNKDLGYSQIGARLSFLEGSFHKAWDVNGANVDLCGAAQPIAIILGSNHGTFDASTEDHVQIKSKRDITEGRYKLCAGVQVGPVGHLSHEFALTTDYQGYLKLENTTGLKHIFGSPVGLEHSYQQEKTRDGESRDVNFFKANLVF